MVRWILSRQVKWHGQYRNADDDIQLNLAINGADFDFVSIPKADGDTTLSVTSNAVTVSGEIADMEFTNMNRQTETSTAVVHGDLDAKFTLKMIR